MAEKIKVVVLDKKTPRGVVNIFGNIQNKVGTYNRDKIEQFKKKLLEKSMDFGEKILIVFDEIDYSIISITDKFFDKILDSYDRSKGLVQEEDKVIDKGSSYSDEEYIPSSFDEVIPRRKINFEDLEPLGNVIDEEDDIVSLQELKMELLSGDYDDISSKESSGIRKK